MRGWLCAAHLSLQAGARSLRILVLAPRGPSDRCLRTHSEAPAGREGSLEGIWLSHLEEPLATVWGTQLCQSCP